jgi:plasminogen activator
MKKVLLYIILTSSLYALDTIPDQKIQLPPESKPIKNSSKPEWITFSTYSGYINGKTKEIVYSLAETGEIYRLSQLDWKIRNLWILGGTIKANFYHGLFQLCLDGWQKMASSQATMIDRDWQNEQALHACTDISWSPSDLIKANSIALESEFDFYKLHQGRSTLLWGVLFGYQFFQLNWKDFGGTYSYDNGTHVGEFEKIVGISYSQKYSIPYYGLQMGWEWNKVLEAAVFGKFTWIAHIQEKDIHHLREIVFEQEFTDGHYWIVGALLQWTMQTHLLCDFKYEYSQLNKADGYMVIKEAGEDPKYSAGAGVYHNHQALKLGLTVVF